MNFSLEEAYKDGRSLINTLFPICRSIMGNGVRKSLKILRQIVYFNIYEVPTGTVCYDWKIPDEWNIKEAFIKDAKGNKIVDFHKNNLHIVNYSIPFKKRISFHELDRHLHTLAEIPKAIPYRTSYYSKNWGFCLSHNQYKKLNRDSYYDVYIDSSLRKGSLTYGERVLKGNTNNEYLFSSYCCHPSLANDNLSGIILWVLLLRELRNRKLRNTYRFVLAPETIGAITYISRNEEVIKRLHGGFIITCVAGPGKFCYKNTFLGNHLIDRITRKVFKDYNIQYIEYPFDIYGSDERQYSSPYFRVPIGTISKSKYYEYKNYHTSLDNLEFITINNLIKTLKIYLLIIDYLEKNSIYVSTNQKCEPMYNKIKLYPGEGGSINPNHMSKKTIYTYENKKLTRRMNDYDLTIIRWLMFYCDGQTGLFNISEKLNLPLNQVYENAENLVRLGLLKKKNI